MRRRCPGVEFSSRYWSGMEGDRRLNHCYYYSVFGVGSTECLCDQMLCNETNQKAGLGLNSFLLLLCSLIMGWI